MPKKLEVQATVPEKKDAKGVVRKQIGPLTIKVNAPENAEEAIKMFGGEAVLTNAIANWVVTLQGNMRGGMKRGETLEQLQARLGSAKMGVSQKGAAVDYKQRFLADYATATPEERAKMRKMLEDAAKA